MVRDVLILIALVIALRVPFLNQPVQGDDVYYLYGAQHALIDPAHPLDTEYAFLGQMVTMRGHPHPPLNVWVLAGLLAMFGDVNETAFHAVYIVFSLLAALAMYALARRFCERPLWATLLFLAVPAFVVSGTTLESDLPFLAFWMAAIALFVSAGDRGSRLLLPAAVIASALAALAAYQAVLLTPILGVYLWLYKRDWKLAWVATLAAPCVVLIVHPPSSELANNLAVLETLTAKARSAIALTGHLLFLVSPVIWIAALLRKPKPKLNFLTAWAGIFFLAAILGAFAGAARYLLPMAAPVAILAATAVTPRILSIGLGLNLALSLGLAAANDQHWSATRDFANEAVRRAEGRRMWVNGEWGLRYYLESAGALPLLRDTIVDPGDVVVSSELGSAFSWKGPGGRLFDTVVSPSVPLRLISLDGGSGYSTSAKGLWPFEISREPVDRLTAQLAVELKPELSYLDPKDARASQHIVTGLYEDGWMSGEASLVLKTPEDPRALTVVFFIPENASARRMQIFAAGREVANASYDSPGAYALTAPFRTDSPTLELTLRVDQTFSAPGDARRLGLVITGVGFR